jgi:hypothetical protein
MVMPRATRNSTFMADETNSATPTANTKRGRPKGKGKGKGNGTPRETFSVTITLGKRHHSRLSEMAKPFAMTLEEAGAYILKKQLEK